MKAFILFILFMLSFFWVSSIQSETLGRLFFSPEQRSQLDYNLARKTVSVEAPAPMLTVNGIVQKNGGKRTVWINGAALNSGQRDELATEVIAVPGQSKLVKIKVGQKLRLEAPQSSFVPAE